MPLSNFNGNTFVAFLDISGFKELMKDKQLTVQALDWFYQSGFNAIRTQNRANTIEGIFVSDCGILFVRDINQSIPEQLDALLLVIKAINEKVLRYDIMLTTSVSYGHFSYQEKIEFQGIEKNPLHGLAYVDAFLDNETGKPKIQPGQCRILKDNLPETLNIDNPFIRKKGKHYFYYWNVQNSNRIDEFLYDYNDSYNQKYLGFKKALKKYQQ